MTRRLTVGGADPDLPLIESVLDSCPDGVIGIDAAQTVRFANARAAILFGWRKRQMVTRPLLDLIPAAARDGHADLVSGFLAAPSPRPMRGRVVHGLHRDGHLLPLLVSLAPVYSLTGIHAVAWIREVTDHHAEEASS